MSCPTYSYIGHIVSARPDDGGSKLLSIVCQYLPDYNPEENHLHARGRENFKSQLHWFNFSEPARIYRAPGRIYYSSNFLFLFLMLFHLFFVYSKTVLFIVIVTPE
jgi:hypothetical protein